MKKTIVLYFIPVFIQIILIPFWYKIGYKYIDASIISILTCLLTPIYLVIINLVFGNYKQGIIFLHIGMLAIIGLGVLFSHIGWGMLSRDFFNPDPMTVAFEKFYLQFGAIVVLISFIVSFIVKQVKK